MYPRKTLVLPYTEAMQLLIDNGFDVDVVEFLETDDLLGALDDGTLDAIRANWFANDITLVSKYAADYKK